MSTNSGSSSLRPAWKGGRGFQPPPTVTSDSRPRSSSIGGDSMAKRDANKFSALQDDEGEFISIERKKGRDRHTNNSSTDSSNNNGEHKQNARSEAFRSSFHGRASKPGRSLADLAARVPDGISRAASVGTYPATGAAGGGGGTGGRRFSDLAGRGGSGDPAQDALEGRNNPRAEPSEYKKAVEAAKCIRYTREKLLSMRPRPDMNAGFPPPHLKHVEAVVLLSEEPQDPVCWDANDADADEIWAAVPMRRSSVPMPKGGPTRGGEELTPGERRRSYNAPNTGRWQRGVALPPSEEKRGSGKDKDANHPSDLWDDPVGGATGAAMDFSAFGGMPEGDLKGSGSGGGGDGASTGSGDTFDFEKMAEATRKFEEELHGSRGSNDLEDEEEINARQVHVDPKRPLATIGTTIRSGSGDNVNVFEDFDAPTEEDDLGEQPALDDPAAAPPAEEPTSTMTAEEEASSRLMAMIGVKKEDNAGSGLLGLGGPSSSTSIPLNPWGGPMLPTPQSTQQNVGLGMDLASRLESFAAEQKAREAAEMEQKELLRRRQEQEESQRRALAQQQQAQERARQQAQQQQAMQQQQQPSPQAQVELVLMERITTILENSWGRSDLVSILSTLHAEDSRVIPLLGNVDLLRDLIAHNPRRVALRQDPAFGTEMAVLQMTNAQFQQHEAQVRAQQQEELRRREEQIRMETIQRQRSMSTEGPPRINPDAPWFYSDPQNNIQGPFRGDEMRQWLEAGYFKGDLPISQQASGPFIVLSGIFPDLSVAFMPQQNDRAQEEAEARARAAEERRQEERRMEERMLEEQRHAEERRLEERRLEERRLEEQRLAEERRRAEEEYERQRHAEELARKEHEAREAAERERQEMEAAEAAAAAANVEASNGANQSSAQLKMMLGLSGDAGGIGVAAQPPQPAPNAVEQSAEKRRSKADNNNNKNSNNQKRAKEPVPVQQQAPPPAAKPAAPAWGGAATNATTSRKSMSEIQKEEARRAAALAMQQGTQPRQQPSSGWANVAASGSSAWTPGTVKPSATMAGGGPATAAKTSAQAAARPKQTAVEARKPTGQQQRATGTAAEEFGASMSPALEKWCKDYMKKLNGTEDLTLVSFCMTLTDAIEIRQYLTTYLGSTPEVNTFATEFIKLKASQHGKEEWETLGSPKKGRKKKTTLR
ncbi:GYF domain [Seminavis robusta]|uniref:GYF domain n=1 Tax=Seminavis robusta TaxID=568900 RepID=A0A9N8DCM4_9STRA|nr:GYF domain [Seminavis robusta]|eukprot:Sro35_g022190.1 GYF domain (1167) ;mRNA; r:13482-17232